MANPEHNLCLFRQIEAAVLVRDSDEESSEELDTDSDIVRAFDRPSELGCRVGGCALTGQKLMDYIQAFGRVAPREEIDRVVAPSCAILDVPHDSDRELLRIQEESLTDPNERP